MTTPNFEDVVETVTRLAITTRLLENRIKALEEDQHAHSTFNNSDGLESKILLFLSKNLGVIFSRGSIAANLNVRKDLLINPINRLVERELITDVSRDSYDTGMDLYRKD